MEREARADPARQEGHLKHMDPFPQPANLEGMQQAHPKCPTQAHFLWEDVKGLGFAPERKEKEGECMKVQQADPKQVSPGIEKLWRCLISKAT